ncbi:MAG: hypothetical protein JSR58_07100 [Verrucomicrobia bacterium]|nr:hypothetical protein [Verrucomicrobiota bacterium]
MLKTILITLLLLSPFIHCEEVIVKPQDEYATIDTKESNHLLDTLLDPNSPAKTKRSIITQIDKDPGSYIPIVLMAAGIYYLEHDLDKAAHYCRAASFRTIVDVEWAQDSSLQDVPGIIHYNIQKAVAKHITTPEKKEAWLKSLQKATRELIAWDKTTPRNYDRRWVCLHSIGAFTGRPIASLSEEKKKEILEKEYATFTKENKAVLEQK